MANIQMASAFKELFQPARYKIFKSGRGPGKSWNFGRALLTQAYQKKKRILCTREIQNSISDSVLYLLEEQAEIMKLSSFYNFGKKEVAGDNGSQFLFSGLLRNIASIKSKEGFDIVWIEEGQSVSQYSLDVLIPTIRKPGSEIWISYNPENEDDPVDKLYRSLQGRDDAILRDISWRDNPWFPEELRKEMEWDRKHDYEKYLWIWEGNYRTISEAQVFRGKFRVDRFEAPCDTVFYYGGDWGFATDPTTLLRCYIQDRTLFVDYEAYKVGVEIDHTPALYRTVPGSESNWITADSARPETISYMNRHGFKVRKSVKGKGSVEDGVEFLRSFDEIVIHERCRHTATEFKLYKYKTDPRTGDILPQIEDKNNHCIDALRYAIEKVRRRMPKVTIKSRLV